MSLSPHQRGNISNAVKQNVEEIEDVAQHSGDVFYNVGSQSLEQTHSSAGARVGPSHDLQGTAVFKPDKAYQVWGHFQQSVPVKWVHQEQAQTSTWFQGAPNPTKHSQNVVPPISGVQKTNHDMEALQQEKMHVPFSEPSQALAPGVEWDHHTMAATHHAQIQALQQGHKPGDPQYQPHAMRHAVTDSTLQPFQLAFGPTKQPQASGVFQAFHGNSASQNLSYSEQPESQQQLLHLQQQHRQHQHQMQQLQQMKQLQQRQQQQQQQRLHQMQQQYHHQQKLLQQMQQMQKQQQQPLQSLQQPESFTLQVQQQEQRPTRPKQPEDSQLKVVSTVPSHQRHSATVQAQAQNASPQSPVNQDSELSKAPQEPQEVQVKTEFLPRRSRRLSKDGLSPVSSQPPKEPATNGSMGGQGPPGGVIQSTQRRRRASKEINLETLAQKASEMEFLPAKRDEGSGRQAGILPLVIPVSVPVRKSQGQTELAGSFSESIQQQFQYDRKPSVIVARRRSLRNSASESFHQDEDKEDGKSPDKIKRRPRPEPLVIPKPCTFIAPSLYSSISSYQSHLRSPVRTLDHPLTLPPYTPPPILSPVREGSGLYFSTFLSSIAAGNQVLPPPPTPKTASKSLLRSTSSDITPPVLPLIGEATPVSLEPRINIGTNYQAEIPELQEQILAAQDQHKATLLWLPLPEAESTPSQKERVDSLMNMACTSVLRGGGTNVELMHHCLHENRGDVMKTLEMMLMKNPLFTRNHHLANYHYAGSDCWTVDEKRYFNKGITAYRKDFFLVQKLVRSKTVAQCVEFYYTYKKQVKVGRNGTLTYGPPDPEERPCEIIQKQEQPEKVEQNKQKVQTEEPQGDGADPFRTMSLQVKENVDKVLVLSIPKIISVDDAVSLRKETKTAPSAPKPPPESTGKRSQPSAASKSQGEPEGVFPCKKCSRVFYKVKSRSAHMKSHAEQEKKAAAAQRQREEAEQAAAKARLEAIGRMNIERGREGGQEDSSEPDDERDEDWS